MIKYFGFRVSGGIKYFGFQVSGAVNASHGRTQVLTRADTTAQRPIYPEAGPSTDDTDTPERLNVLLSV